MVTTLPILHQGRSLALRRSIPEDAPFLFENMYQNPDFMTLFRLNDPVDSERQLAERIAKRLQIDPAKSGYLEVLILHQQHGIIGIVALADYSSLHRRAEFLIGLFNPDHRRSIYGLEGSLLIGDLAFNQYSLHRLYAYTYEYNYYAQKALIAGGFRQEGMMQEHVFDGVTQKFINLHIYGLTEPQFRQNLRLARLAKRLVGRDITQQPPTLPPPLINQPSKPPSFVRSGTIQFNDCVDYSNPK